MKTFSLIVFFGVMMFGDYFLLTAKTFAHPYLSGTLTLCLVTNYGEGGQEIG